MASNVASGRRIVIVTPASRGSRSGNRKTALRWACLMRQLGATVRVATEWDGEPCDVLFAVHAVKSRDSVLAAAARPDRPRIAVLLAGTDIYPAFRADPSTLRALKAADALLALQPNAVAALPPGLQAKARTIVQSATAITPPPPRYGTFTACMLAHLRPVKGPLLPFEAMTRLGSDVSISFVLAGRAMTSDVERDVRAAASRDPRCRWLGEIPRRQARELLARSHLCLVPSTAEGGANVISEALAARTPILCSAIPGNTGLLGNDWPGLFPPGDAGALAERIRRAATDPNDYQKLIARTDALHDLVSPAREREALARLLADLEVAATGESGEPSPGAPTQ